MSRTKLQVFERILLYRRRKGWTQGRMAEALGIGRRTLTKLETDPKHWTKADKATLEKFELMWHRLGEDRRAARIARRGRPGVRSKRVRVEVEAAGRPVDTVTAGTYTKEAL
jgi:transcriptional regulator with XRE-family HTH domain